MTEPKADPNSVPTWTPYQPITPQPPLLPQPVGRPGITTAAAVLGFVQAGLAIAGGLIVILASLGMAGERRAPKTTFEQDVADHASLLVTIGALQLACCGVLIAGSVVFLGGRSRTLYLIGMGLQLAVCLVYLVLSSVAMSHTQPLDDTSPAGGFLVFAVAFLVMPIIGLAFAATASSTRFLQAFRVWGIAR